MWKEPEKDGHLDEVEKVWALEPGRLGTDLYVSTRREANHPPHQTLASSSWKTEDTCLIELCRGLAKMGAPNKHLVDI